MNDFIAAFMISAAFMTGFWVGVDWYRKKIIEETLNEKTARTK